MVDHLDLTCHTLCVRRSKEGSIVTLEHVIDWLQRSVAHWHATGEQAWNALRDAGLHGLAVVTGTSVVFAILVLIVVVDTLVGGDSS
jgi:hypothetical protein